MNYDLCDFFDEDDKDKIKLDSSQMTN